MAVAHIQTAPAKTESRRLLEASPWTIARTALIERWTATSNHHQTMNRLVGTHFRLAFDAFSAADAWILSTWLFV